MRGIHLVQWFPKWGCGREGLNMEDHEVGTIKVSDCMGLRKHHWHHEGTIETMKESTVVPWERYHGERYHGTIKVPCKEVTACRRTQIFLGGKLEFLRNILTLDIS